MIEKTSKIILTKELIIEAYKNNKIENFENLSEFKLIILLLENFPNIKISKDFPKYLLLDNFDLMLDIFADWDYSTTTDKDIEKIINIIENYNEYNIDIFHIKNNIFAITTYAPKNIVNKFNNISL